MSKKKEKEKVFEDAVEVEAEVVDYVEPPSEEPQTESKAPSDLNGEKRSYGEDGHIILGEDGYPFKRNMDPMTFRIPRDGKWVTLCFTDMTMEERIGMLGERDQEWLANMAFALADRLRYVADELDLMVMPMGENPEDSEDSSES